MSGRSLRPAATRHVLAVIVLMAAASAHAGEPVPGHPVLHALERRNGTEAMDELLLEYMTGDVASTGDLLDIVERVAGGEVRAALRADLAQWSVRSPIEGVR